jgi:metal-responsive CopG/Arc/MetJ family transcriptional regulator
MMRRKATAGRPVTVGGDKYVGLRLSSELLSQIDALARVAGVESRSEFIRVLLEAGVRARLRKATPVKRKRVSARPGDRGS